VSTLYDIRPDYTPETLSIADIRQLIWAISGRNNYTVLIAKCRCGYENNGSLYQYSKLLKEVQKLKREAEERRPAPDPLVPDKEMTEDDL
jgi:hypothetical protein